MSSTTVRLAKGDSPNWGFRLQGGKDFGTPLVIQKVNGGSPAERAGLVAGDAVIRINNVDVYNLLHKEAQDVIVRAGHTFDMTIQRGGSTWRPSVVPVGPAKSTPHINDARPVTKTSLAARPGENIGAIGTGHNVAAKPFSPQVNGSVNGVPKLVNKQYNSPLKLYSEDAIAETISAQSEVLSTGALGVNFKKNEKNYDATNSAVYRMLQEAENEPRSPTGEEPDSGIVTAPNSGAAGLRHVAAPQTRPTAPKPQLPPGQNICADCERLIVGVFVRIKDKNLHVECFKCSTCGSSLKNVGYYNINNKLYCDVHAKAAARSNPVASLGGSPFTPAPPGAPANAISQALQSHSLAAPLSPKINSLGTSYQPSEEPAASSVDVPSTPLPTPNISTESNKIIGSTTNSNLYSSPAPVPFSKYINKPTQNYSTAPKPFSSVSAPLSPGGTLPRAAPLSPASTLPRSPLSPVIAAPAPTYNSYSPASSAGRYSSLKPTSAPFKGKTSHNIVWPPPQEKTEVPTACPLFYPPPSQVEASIIHKREQKIRNDSENYEENLEVEGINAMASNPYFSEDISYAGRRKSTSECVEILSETLQTQKFVESIVQQNVNVNIPPVIVTEATSDLKRPTEYSPNTIECSLPNKIDNAVPQKWESPLTQVIRTTPPDKDTFSQIPSKKSSSALVSALSTAPDTPFTPIPHSSLDPVPLPEMTEPYFPPERKITVCSEEKTPTKAEQTPKSESPFLQALKVAPDRPFTPVGGSGTAATPPPKKKVKDPTKKYFEDLPKPTEKLDMRTALTTAPDRPYSPLVSDVKSVDSSESKQKNVSTIDKSILEKPLKPDVLPESFKMNKKEPKPPSYYPPSVLYEATQENYSDVLKKESQSKQTTITETQTIQPGEKTSQIYVQNEGVEREKQTAFAPIFQGFSCSFQNKTDHSQFSIEINTTPPVPTPPPKPQTPIAYIATVEERPSIITKQTVTEEKSDSQKVCSKQEKSKEEIKITTEIPKQREEVVQVKPISVTSMLKKPEALPQYQVELQQTAEADLRYMEKVKKMQSKKSEQQHVSFEQSALTSKEMNEDTLRQQKITKPIITLQPGDNNNNIPSKHTFQPVLEDKPQNTSFSPKPRALTPSMMSKPPPILPYYQANLVAQHQPAPMTHLLDPKSPNMSRSPSPCVDKLRSPSPFVVKAKEDRSKSPAAGPPQNPLQGSRPLPTPESSRVEVAKQNLTAFIPEYKSRRDLVEHARGMDFYKREQPVEGSQMYASQVESSSQSFPMVSSYEKYATKSENYEKEQEMYKAQKYDVKDDKKKASYVSQSEQGVVQTDISQRSHQENLEALKKSQSHSVERSDDGLCQIQRKKTVVEEYESSHKEQTIEIAKNITSTKQYPFSKSINNPEIDTSSSKGQSTNPHPISCKKQKDQPQIECCNKKPCQPLQECPCPTCPMASQPVTKPVFAPPTPVQHVSAPGPSKNTNVVPQTDAGLGGGRQSGGISVTPRRGRGVLNAASVGGSRVPLCGSCHSQIRGPFITALGKIWCPQHFVCATPSCRRPLQDIGFVEEKGQLHCEYCFEQYLAPPCSKCGSKIKGDCLKAIGKNFHPECFNCSYCGKLFGNNPFFLEDGSPYCEADWNEMFTTKCFACGFPVEAGDRWVEALNNNYHSQCFNCTMCKKNLEGQSFFAKGGRPFCKNHAR